MTAGHRYGAFPATNLDRTGAIVLMHISLEGQEALKPHLPSLLALQSFLLFPYLIPYELDLSLCLSYAPTLDPIRSSYGH